jgi:hypothetical protein
VEGKVFFSPDAYAVQNERRFRKKDGYQHPQLQLLRVCKQIHAEAEEVYLSKNLFMLPDHFMYHNPNKPLARLASITFGPLAFAENHSSPTILGNI